MDAPLPLFTKFRVELLLPTPMWEPRVDCSLSVRPWILSTKLCRGSAAGLIAAASGLKSTILFRFGMEPFVCDVTGAQAAVLLIAAIWFSALPGIWTGMLGAGFRNETNKCFANSAGVSQSRNASRKRRKLS